MFTVREFQIMLRIISIFRLISQTSSVDDGNSKDDESWQNNERKAFSIMRSGAQIRINPDEKWSQWA